MASKELHIIESGFLNDHELNEVIDLVNSIHGMDFSNYGIESLRRRFNRLMMHFNCKNEYELKFAITNGQISLTELLAEITVNVTSMFRDVKFYNAAKEHLMPYIETFPSFKIWHAGCSTGEEMFSFAILLNDQNLLKRCTQYGTDLNQDVIKQAKSGIYDLKEFSNYANNYMQCGGTKAFSDYYTAKYNQAKMASVLSKNMVFSQHNLVKDSSFNEFQCVICRNVLIYFNKTLKNKVLQLFLDSLSPRGYLMLGNGESIKGTVVENQLEVIDVNQRIYRKKIS